MLAPCCSSTYPHHRRRRRHPAPSTGSPVQLFRLHHRLGVRVPLPDDEPVAHKTSVLSSSPTKACLSLLWSSSSVFLFFFFFIVFCLPAFFTRPFSYLLLPPLCLLLRRFSSRIFPLAFSSSASSSSSLRLLSLSLRCSLFSVLPPPDLSLSPSSPPRPLLRLSSYHISLFPTAVLPARPLRLAAWPPPLRLRANLFRDERHSVAPFTVTRP